MGDTAVETHFNTGKGDLEMGDPQKELDRQMPDAEQSKSTIVANDPASESATPLKSGENSSQVNGTDSDTMATKGYTSFERPGSSSSPLALPPFPSDITAAKKAEVQQPSSPRRLIDSSASKESRRRPMSIKFICSPRESAGTTSVKLNSVTAVKTESSAGKVEESSVISIPGPCVSSTLVAAATPSPAAESVPGPATLSKSSRIAPHYVKVKRDEGSEYQRWSFEVPHTSVGVLIGPGGSVHKQLMRQFRLELFTVSPLVSAGNHRLLQLRGKFEDLCDAVEEMERLFAAKGVDGGTASRLKTYRKGIVNLESPFFTEIMDVVTVPVGLLLGSGGIRIKDIETKTRTVIYVLQSPKLATRAVSVGQLEKYEVMIQGNSQHDVQTAVSRIQHIIDLYEFKQRRQNVD